MREKLLLKLQRRKEFKERRQIKNKLFLLFSLYLVLVCSSDFKQPVNFDGSEELLNGGETRDKLSLVFSLFPPSTDIVRRDTLYEGVYNDFEDS